MPPCLPLRTANPNYVMRLGENPPVLMPETPAQVIFGAAGPPSNGLVYLNSLYYQRHRRIRGFAELPHALREQLEHDDLLAGDANHHGGDRL